MKHAFTTTATAALTAAAAVALTAPAAASADPETRCTTDPGGGTYTCTTLTPTTMSPASTGSRSGVSDWAQSLPSLGLPFWIGLALIITGAVIYAVTKPSTTDGRDAHGPAAGAARAEARGEKVIAIGMIGLGLPLAGWGVAGIGGAILGGLIGVPLILWAGKADSDTDVVKAGYAAAEAQYQQQVQQARQAHAAWTPDPADFDPHGIGVRPPAAPPLQLPAEPQMTDQDARRFARVGFGVEIEPGSAAAQLLTTDGSDHLAREAWTSTCTAENFVVSEMQASRIPGRPAEQVTVPAADYVTVRPLPGGDALLVVRPRAATLSTRELSRITQTFLNTARIRSASAWEREHATNLHSIRLSNTAAPATPEPEQQPAPAPVDDDPWS